MIEKASLVAKLTGSKEVKDYTYTILFLLISSFFGLFVIKPVLSIAVSLDKEAKELRVVNDMFEKNINTMVNLQTQMQEIRSQAYLVDIAIPQEPSIQALMQDIRSAALNQGINLVTIELTQDEDKKKIVLAPGVPRPPKTTLTAKPVTMRLVIESDFDQAVAFIKTISNQRRLKTIRKISLDKDQDAKGSSHLTIDIEVEGYHL